MPPCQKVRIRRATVRSCAAHKTELIYGYVCLRYPFLSDTRCRGATAAASANTRSAIAVPVKVEQPEHAVLVAAGTIHKTELTYATLRRRYCRFHFVPSGRNSLQK
jgi:hypothetical protein